MTFDGEVDQSVDQFGVRHARCLPQLWIHGDGRESGHGVHLVAQKATTLGFEEEVDTSQALASQGGEHPQREASHLVALFGGQFGRNDEARTVGDVLVLVVVEVVAGHDLAGHAGHRFDVSEHRHLDLTTDDGLFAHDPFVVGERRSNGGHQFVASGHLGHADGRTHVGGLHEHGQSECIDDLIESRHRHLVLAQRHEVRLRYSERRESVLGHAFVHAQRRTEDPGSDVREAHQFE